MNDTRNVDEKFVSQNDLLPVINNDKKARRAFVKQFERMVWYAARKIYLKHRNIDQDDICMELWVSVFERNCLLLRKFRGESKFSTYFAVCMAHNALDVGRRISREARGLPLVVSNASNLMFDWLEELNNRVVPENKPKDPQQLLEEKQAKKRVRKVIHELPAKQRQFFEKAVIEEEPVKKLAAEFGLGTKNNVYKWRYRTLATIREHMRFADAG